MHDDDPWKQLQQQLGLLASDDQPAAPPAPPAKAAPSEPAPEPKPAPRVQAPTPPPAPPRYVEPEPEFASGFGAGLDEPQSLPRLDQRSDEVVATGDENTVEMGEAPEEVPDDPATTEEGKRRRRRRRRRGRKSDETPSANGEAIEALTGDDATDSELDDESGDDGDSPVENDDDEVEPITFTDWNVPTWQELIGSLYRPER